MSYEDVDDLFEDETYAFVEDTYIEADDLAEHAVPSPPPTDDFDDFDPDLWQYDYWMDIDYGSDGDEIRQRQSESRLARSRKRKLGPITASSKKRRVQSRSRKKTGRVPPLEELPPVLLVKDGVEQRYEPQDVQLTDTRDLKSWALLSNWREQFRNTPMWQTERPRVQLEEVHDAPDDPGPKAAAAMLDQAAREELPEEEEWEDEEDEGDEDLAEDGLDPEAVRMALRQNLAAAGINAKGMDESALMAYAMRMFSAGNDAVVDEFADQLLTSKHKAKSDGEAGASLDDADDGSVVEEEQDDFGAWVRQQAEEKASTRERQELPTPVDSDGMSSASPPGLWKTAVPDDGTGGKKRKADSVTDDPPAPKRLARNGGFAAPTAASKARIISTTNQIVAGSGRRRDKK